MKLTNFLDQNPAFAIISSYRQLSKFQKALAEKFNLNFYQCLILSGLYFEDRGIISPQDLVITLNTTKGTISQCLAILEEYKLLTVKICKTDKRRQNLWLTTKGEEKAISIISYFEKNQSKIEKTMGIGNVNSLISNLSEATRFYSN